jgi:CRP-like cAMP-binding protein
MLHRLFTPSVRAGHAVSLSQIVLFKGLTPRELRTVDTLFHWRDYLAEEVIFDEGEEGQAVYFILSGKVLICRQGRPADGAIATLGPGECFGEMALLDDAPRMAQARAAENCTLGMLFREDFRELLQTHAMLASKLTLALAHILAARLRETVHRYVM